MGEQYNRAKQGATKRSNDPNASYGSGSDPRGRLQNQSAHQQERYESQQGPMAQAMGMNYGRASEANYGDYTDIMNNYRSIYSGGGGGGGGGVSDGGFNAMGMYTPFTVSAGRAGYNDPFKSYAGYEKFSDTGGYSPEDIANMRARGISPIRAAYANAERNVGQQRSLQGGYSPNAIAAQVKMAREQGQGMADATQNVEAQLAQMRQEGKLAGLGGMSNIEGQRLGADVDISKFNTGLDFQAQQYNADAYARAQAQNIGAGESAAGRSAAASAASQADRLRALSGATNLFGTTPGMSQLFGNQLLTAVGQGGQFGNQLYGNDINAQTRPGAWEQNMGRIQGVSNMVGAIANPLVDYFGERNRNQQRPYDPYEQGTVGSPPMGQQDPYGDYGGGGYGGGGYQPNYVEDDDFYNG